MAKRQAYKLSARTTTNLATGELLLPLLMILDIGYLVG